MEATAVAHPNMALVKYWGKRDEDLLLPQNGSIAITMGELESRTTVRFEPKLDQDSAILNGKPVDVRGLRKLSRSLNALRQLAGRNDRARVESTSNFPVAAGLASSASGFAAIAVAAAAALDLDLDPAALSRIARLGSGSATRSIHGGFVEWIAGSESDGRDSQGRQIAPADHWDLRLVVALCTEEEKAVGSTPGMQRTVETSPFYGGWLKSVDDDLNGCREAILKRDLERLGTIAEQNCLKMHALMMSSVPPLLYWEPGTLACIRTVRRLRHEGIGAWFTIDAGPNVAVICEPDDAVSIEAALRAVPEVEEVLQAPVGGPARIVED